MSEHQSNSPETQIQHSEKLGNLDILVKEIFNNPPEPSAFQLARLRLIGGSSYPLYYATLYLKDKILPAAFRLEDRTISHNQDDSNYPPPLFKFRDGMRGILDTGEYQEYGEEFAIKIVQISEDEKASVAIVEEPTHLPINVERFSVKENKLTDTIVYSNANNLARHIFIILSGIETNGNIEIDEYNQILKLEPADIAEIRSFLGSHFKNGKPMLFFDFTHVLVHKEAPDISLNSNIDVPYVPDLLKPILMTLRLFKPGFISFENFIWFGRDFRQILPVLQYMPQEVNQIYKIGKSEENSLKEFWAEFQQLKPIIDQYLNVPLERFMSSYSQKGLENRLMDIIIGLESIFSESSESIKYKYALRGAAIIGNDSTERQELFKILKDSYDHRSIVAHGLNGRSKKEEKIKEILPVIQQALASAIKKTARWIKNNKDKKLSDFIKDIDAKLLSGKL